MELTATQILDYIHFLNVKHRATLDRLYKEGKSYRSRDVAREQGYLNALQDLQDALEEPERARKLHEAISKLGAMLKE